MNASPTKSSKNDSLGPQRILRRAGQALKLGRSLTSLVMGVVTTGVVLVLWMIVDSRVRFGVVGRWGGFVAAALPLLSAVVVIVRVYLRRQDDAALARRIETATGRNDNALVNAVQLDRALGGGSPWRNVLLGELAGLWSDIPWKRVYNWSMLKRGAWGVGILFILGLAGFAWRPTEFRQRLGRVLMPAREIAPVTRTHVIGVTPGNRVVARGTVLTMGVELTGKAPDEVWMVITEADGSVERHMTKRVGQSFTWTVDHKWQEGGDYGFEAGDARSFERRIDVRFPAKVVGRRLAVTPPAYTGLKPILVPDGATWPSVPQGSDVVVDWVFDRGIRDLKVDHDDVKVSAAGKPEAWKLSGRLKSNKFWPVRWTDINGLTDKRVIEFNLKADEPPSVRLIQPTGEEEVLLTRDAWLRLSFEATDDYGLADVTVCRGTPERPESRVIRSWQPRARSLREKVDIPLSSWLGKEETEAWFCVVARDNNNITGPGRTISRLLVVKIVSPEELKLVAESHQGGVLGNLDDLLRLQQTNLDATRQAARNESAADKGDVVTLVERQMRVEAAAGQIVAATPPGSAPWRDVLEGMLAKEMLDAVMALRDAAPAKGATRLRALAKGEALETAILARLKNLPTDFKNETAGAVVLDLIGKVEDLFNREKSLHAQVIKATAGSGAAIARDQDALADNAQVVRKALADAALNSSIGDAAFRKVLGKAAALMGQTAIYEQMLKGAEQIEQEHFPEAAPLCKQVLVDLAKVLELLNASQRSHSGDQAESLKEMAAGIKEKLEALVEQQRVVVEKSKELAHKDEFKAEDMAAAKELAAEKKSIEDLIEKMLTDAHAFPDLKPMNELREELTKIYEDVIQKDAAQAAVGALKPSEIAVQKEESLLSDIEKAKETAEDMEMWLPDKNDTTKWLMENFDVAEMPEIPNLPLPDAFTDLVGDLLREQEDLAQQVQDAASNNALAVNPANGWEVADGPMPGFNAQGKSGNTRPNKNEQTGRSSGGREGMSSGEMVNQRADHLEGSSIDARRTNDPMQKGQVQDNGPPADAKATGGGKAGGASQRTGMTGDAPLRAMNSPDQILNNALAAEQALLAQQSAKSYATARLFYLKTGRLPEVARLMDESHDALKSGRLADFEALHSRIVGRLRELGEGRSKSADNLSLGAGSRYVGEKRLPGGADVAVPAGYEQPVDDYFRSLDTP